MSINFQYKPEGDTLKTFMKSEDFFRGMRGPVGSGKSVACCIEIFRRALLQQKNAEGKRNIPILNRLNPRFFDLKPLDRL